MVLLVAGVALTPLALRSSDRVPIGVLVGLVALVALDVALAHRRIGTPRIRVDAPAVTAAGVPFEIAVDVEEPTGELVEVGFGGLGPMTAVVVPGSTTVPVPPTRWGLFPVWMLRVTARGPLGLASCSRQIAHVPHRPTAVLPRPAPHPPLVLDEIPGNADGDPTDVVGLREGRAGAPLRDVHWPTVARTGRIVVRDRRPVADLMVPIVVSLDRWADDPEAAIDGSDAIALARTAGAAVLANGCRIQLHCSRLRALPPGTTLDADVGRLDAHAVGVEAAVSTVCDVAGWSQSLASLAPGASFALPDPPYLLVRSSGVSWERER